MSSKTTKVLGTILFIALSVTVLSHSFQPSPYISTLETVGFLAGLLWIWFLIRENPWGWLAGIVSSSCYVIFFYQGKLFGDAALNMLYVALGILGWYWWVRGVDRGGHLKIGRASAQTLLLLALGATAGTLVLVPHFAKGGSPVPIPDAALFCAALAAQFLQARKRIENWPFWIVINGGYVAIYIYKGWYATAVLTTVYAVMAIAGWRGWVARQNKKSGDFRNEVAAQ